MHETERHRQVARRIRCRKGAGKRAGRKLIYHVEVLETDRRQTFRLLRLVNQRIAIVNREASQPVHANAFGQIPLETQVPTCHVEHAKGIRIAFAAHFARLIVRIQAPRTFVCKGGVRRDRHTRRSVAARNNARRRKHALPPLPGRLARLRERFGIRTIELAGQRTEAQGRRLVQTAFVANTRRSRLGRAPFATPVGSRRLAQNAFAPAA